MQIRRGLTVLGAILLLGACSPGGTPTPMSTPVVTVVPSESAPSSEPPVTSAEPASADPSPSETLGPEQLAAHNVVDEFFHTFLDLSKDPGLPLQLLANITTGQTQELYVADLADQRSLGAVLVGEMRWYIGTVDAAMDRDGQVVVPVQACTDVSDSDVIIEETGESIVAPDRPSYVDWQIDVVETSPGRWKVGDTTNTPVSGCDES